MRNLSSTRFVRLCFLVLPPIVFTLLIYPLQVNGYINSHDEGIWLSLVQALLEGKKLYRDVWFQYGPLLEIPFQIHLFFSSPTLASIRAVSWFMNAVGLCVVYGCLFRWVERPSVRVLFCLLVWMTPLAAFSLALPYSIRYGCGFLAILFWPSLSAAPSKTVTNPMCCGIFAALSFFTSQEVGAAALIASLFIYWRHAELRRQFWTYVGTVCAVLTMGAVVISWRYGLRNYVSSTMIDTPLVVAKESLRLPRLSIELWRRAYSGEGSWIPAAQNAAEFLAFYVPPSSCLMAFVISRWRAFTADEKKMIQALAIYSTLSLVSAWGRTDRWHIYFSLTPTLLLWAFATDRALTKNRRGGSLMFFGAIIVGAMLTLPHYFARVRAVRLMSRTHRTMALDRAGTAKVPFAQANAYEFLVNFVRKATRPGEPILFFPYDGAIYFLADRPFPCRYPILAEAVAPYQQREVVRDLEKSNLHWVIWDKENASFDGVPIDQFLNVIDDYLKTHFHAVREIGPFVFLERNAIQ